MKRTTLLLTAALLFSPTLAHAGAADISADAVVVTTPLTNGATKVALIFDLAAWPTGWTYIVRHFCPPGVEMHSQGFAILPQPGAESPLTPRGDIRLTNARNLASGGQQGFSWYIQNDGDSSGPVRLEISFVAKRTVEVP